MDTERGSGASACVSAPITNCLLWGHLNGQSKECQRGTREENYQGCFVQSQKRPFTITLTHKKNSKLPNPMTTTSIQQTGALFSLGITAKTRT